MQREVTNLPREDLENMASKRQSNEQPTLFPVAVPTAYGLSQEPPVRALAHRKDPVTSHEAAARVSRSERAALHRRIAMEIVTAHPGHTGMELFDMATPEQRAELGDHHELYRKMADCRRMGLLDQGEPKICSVKQVRMVTWKAVEKS